MSQPLQFPFKLSNQIQASRPAPHVLLILLNRPEAMNAMSREMEASLTLLLNWFQDNNDFWCVYRQPWSAPPPVSISPQGGSPLWERQIFLCWCRLSGVSTTLPCVSSLERFLIILSWFQRDYTGAGTQVTNDQEKVISMSHGFGSISRRHTLNKPIIAAVNGGAFGGGTEMVLSCDIVIAEKNAKFALPEVKHGVIAAAGSTEHHPI